MHMNTTTIDMHNTASSKLVYDIILSNV